MATATEKGWRGVLVAAPDPLAGIGEALRRAFLVDAAARSRHGFGDLLARLDRAGVAAPDHRRSPFPR
jgi:hypothetical protein